MAVAPAANQGHRHAHPSQPGILKLIAHAREAATVMEDATAYLHGLMRLQLDGLSGIVRASSPMDLLAAQFEYAGRLAALNAEGYQVACEAAARAATVRP